MAKLYEVKASVFEGEDGEENVIYDLVNIEDENDVYMLDCDDSFTEGELISEDDLEFKECNYVDHQGTGTGWFAFKIK